MGTLVQYATHKGIATLTLTAPPVNACGYELFRELDGYVLEARFDNDVHVLVITGQGDRYFSAGVDRGTLREADERFVYYFNMHAGETLRRLESTPKLTIAALNGDAWGLGFDLALACDLRLARAGEIRLGFDEVTFANLPATGGAQRLANVIGRGRALDLIATGSALLCDEAYELGLLNLPPTLPHNTNFQDRVFNYAKQFAPPQAASRAIGALKKSLSAFGDAPTGLAFGAELSSVLHDLEDAREGLAMRDRPARFRGR